MKLTVKFLVSMALLSATSGFAAEVRFFSVPVTDAQVLRVNSDAVAGDCDLKLVLNTDGDVAGIKYVAPAETKNFELSDLPNGLVILNRQGYDVVKLVSTSFDPHSGGEIKMVYLNNGITGSYKTWAMQLTRVGSDWSLAVDEQTGRRSFASMYLKAKKVLGQIVGIDKVTVN